MFCKDILFTAWTGLGVQFERVKTSLSGHAKEAILTETLSEKPHGLSNVPHEVFEDLNIMTGQPTPLTYAPRSKALLSAYYTLVSLSKASY